MVMPGHLEYGEGRPGRPALNSTVHTGSNPVSAAFALRHFVTFNLDGVKDRIR